VLYQNDGFGKEYLIGLKQVLDPDHAGMIVKEASYEPSEPTVDSQVVTLRGSGADVFVIAALSKFATQAIRKSFDIGWNAVRYLTYVSQSIESVLKPAGLDKSGGLFSAAFVKDVTDPRWKEDPDVKAWKDFTSKYMSSTEYADINAGVSFIAAGVIVQVLRQCGDDLSRANIMKQATNLKDLELPLLLPEIKVNTSSINYSPIRQMRLATFYRESWELFGELLTD
jgi:branched-chain amino acid transport system substrate-binding protein